MKIYLPLHCDSGNRGCEAITKATSLLLGLNKDSIVVLSGDEILDKRMGLEEYVTIIPKPKKIPYFIDFVSKVISRLTRDTYNGNCLKYKYLYKDFLNKISDEDIVLSTGGDMLCYGDNEVIYINEYCHKHNIKSILWGCSIGEKNLSKRKLNTLKKFSLIYVRESLTMEILTKHGLSNIVLLPDPAFILKSSPVEDFTTSDKKLVGINLSNFINGEFSWDSIYGQNIKTLIDYIQEHTDYDILLIPHVMWSSQNDIDVCENVKEHYANNDRIALFNSSNYNYCQLREIIGKCELFIGARTHSVISAYSMGVPTLALGYSIKSLGISKDLGLSKELVIDCTKLTNVNQLKESFIYLDANKKSIKEKLKANLSSYIGKLDNIKNIID